MPEGDGRLMTTELSSIGVDLVRRAAAGDDAALALLYGRHNRALSAFFQLHEVEAADAAVGEVFVEAFATIGEVRGGDVEFRLHLFGLANQRLIDPTSDGGGSRAASPCSEITRVLTPERRDVVVAQVAGGFSTQQVALVLRQPHRTVESLQRQALRRLEGYRSSHEGATVPLQLEEAVQRYGGRAGIAALARFTGLIPAVVPSPAVRELLAAPVAPVAQAPKVLAGGVGRRAKVVAVIGTGVGKAVFGATLAAAAVTGGAHASGVVQVPLLPPVVDAAEPTVVEDPLTEVSERIEAISDAPGSVDGVEVATTSAPGTVASAPGDASDGTAGSAENADGNSDGSTAGGNGDGGVGTGNGNGNGVGNGIGNGAANGNGNGVGNGDGAAGGDNAGGNGDAGAGNGNAGADNAGGNRDGNAAAGNGDGGVGTGNDNGVGNGNGNGNGNGAANGNGASNGNVANANNGSAQNNAGNGNAGNGAGDAGSSNANSGG